MAENRWSHEDPHDPLSWHLSALKYRAECGDPLAPDWFDALVLVNRRYVKDLVQRALAANNRYIYDKLNTLEVHMSAVDDALAEADEVTNEIAADLDALADQLADGKSKAEQAAAEKIRTHTEKLRGVAAKYPAAESDEPVEDGEPVGDANASQVPSANPGEGFPVSNFPAVPAEDDADVAPDTDSDVPSSSTSEQGINASDSSTTASDSK